MKYYYFRLLKKNNENINLKHFIKYLHEKKMI